MNAFETIVGEILSREGYWVYNSFRVELTKEEKERIGKHSSPRWEIDVVAYSIESNELLAVECKSFLDSVGVNYGSFNASRSLHQGPIPNAQDRYKLFNQDTLREVVLRRLQSQMAEDGKIRKNPKTRLALACGKIKNQEDRENIAKLFAGKGWKLFSDDWIREKLHKMSEGDYEDSVIAMVAKILLRESS